MTQAELARFTAFFTAIAGQYLDDGPSRLVQQARDQLERHSPQEQREDP